MLEIDDDLELIGRTPEHTAEFAVCRKKDGRAIFIRQIGDGRFTSGVYVAVADVPALVRMIEEAGIGRQATMFDQKKVAPTVVASTINLDGWHKFVAIAECLPDPGQIVIGRTAHGSLYLTRFMGREHQPQFAWDGFAVHGIVHWSPVPNAASVANAAYDALLRGLMELAVELRAMLFREISAPNKLPETLLPDVLDRVSVQLRERVAKGAA